MFLSKYLLSQPIFSRTTLVATVCLLCSLSLFSEPLYAQAPPAVTYTPNINTIFIGSSSGVPASEVISLPALAATLTAAGFPDVVVNQGGNVWLSKAKIVVDATAKLEVTKAAGVDQLRLESVIGKLAFIEVRQGGHLLFDGVTVTSWDTGTNNGPDTNIQDGRTYLVAQNGSRLDILRSDVGYMGDATGAQTSGVAWLKRANTLDPLTGSTGNVEDSKFHNNYQGLFISEGYNLKILRNEIFSNLNQGIYVRDGAQAIEVGGNSVHDNGNKSTGTGDGIVFYNNATQNNIHDNIVFANARNGILIERGSNNNTIMTNEVYQNVDGIAIADADTNLVQGNRPHNNRNGIRVSGSLDDPAANNQIIGNTIEDSASTAGNAYGIYFYAHADSNLIRNNTILRSATYGIYIKSGGNRLEGNIIQGGKTGIAIVGEAEAIGQIPLLFAAGSRNVVISSTITTNTDIGIRIEGGVANGIGADPQTGTQLAGNVIDSNGGNGVFIKGTTAGFPSTDNWLVGNTIRSNGSSGIVVSGAGSDRNRLSQNSITTNGGSGIKVDGGAQQSILPPVINDILADGQVQGAAVANATIEVYNDPSGEGETLLGTATTDGSGAWIFQLPSGQDTKRVTALVIDGSGNTSAFSAASGSSVELFAKVGVDVETQQTVININGPGATATLADIQTRLGAANASLLQNLGSGVWRLNANLKLEQEVTLNLSPDSGVSELQLRSAANPVSGTIDYSGFVYIRTHNGVINIDGVKIYGWDVNSNKVDDTIGDGRAFIIAKFGAELNINNSELSYLGSAANSESYGVTWRDASAEVAAAGIVRTAVTGQVTNSKFHHNFVGAQVIQAGDMTFTNNEFHSNLNYGFYARDNSRDIVLEGNLAYSNSSHGMLLARGCTNFTLRNNKAYTNGLGFAHGIVISQGSAPVLASVENLLEGNEAYGNRGYGINIEGSNNNQVRGNNLHNNQVGVNVEDGSTGNQILSNTVTENTTSGVQVRQGANTNTINNNISTKNTRNGFYIRSDSNTLTGNQATANLGVGIALSPESATALQNNSLISNTTSSNTGSGIDIRGATNTEVRRNRIESNSVHGIYLTDGAVGTAVLNNIISGNIENGIRVNNTLSFQNHWSENSIYGNQLGGINVSAGANNSIARPKITEIEGRFVMGRVNASGATVEIFTDANTQGRYFLGRTTTDAEGNFMLMVSGTFLAPGAVAVATDTQGNSSEFSDTFIVPDVEPDYLLFLPTVNR